MGERGTAGGRYVARVHDDSPLLEDLRKAISWVPDALGTQEKRLRSPQDAAARLRFLADTARCTAPGDAVSAEDAQQRGDTAVRLLDAAAGSAGQHRLAEAVDAVRAAHTAWRGHS
jgi:hypothetical protein